MSESLSPPAAPNIARQPDPVGRGNREAIAGHRGLTLWMTGLSGSGKTTLARAVSTALYETGARVYVLDAENVRHGLCRDLGFSPEDRREHVRRLAEVAGLFVDAATVVIVACISPYTADRDLARTLV
ncbi:MAG: adenylyl-sulfate kinase, partial [Myxococcota bacterium]